MNDGLPDTMTGHYIPHFVAPERSDEPALWFAFRRAEILSAQVNGATLVGLAGLIALEAIQRFVDPADVAGLPVFTSMPVRRFTWQPAQRRGFLSDACVVWTTFGSNPTGR